MWVCCAICVIVSSFSDKLFPNKLLTELQSKTFSDHALVAAVALLQDCDLKDPNTLVCRPCEFSDDTNEVKMYRTKQLEEGARSGEWFNESGMRILTVFKGSDESFNLLHIDQACSSVSMYPCSNLDSLASDLGTVQSLAAFAGFTFTEHEALPSPWRILVQMWQLITGSPQPNQVVDDLDDLVRSWLYTSVLQRKVWVLFAIIILF